MPNQKSVYPLLTRAHRLPWVGRFLPRLCYSHPGFFRVLGAEVLLHIGMGIDFLLKGRNLTAPWAVVPHFMSWLPLIAFFHFLAAAMVLWGLWGNFGVSRWGLRLSVTIFWTLAAALFYAAAFNPISLTWGFLFMFVSLVSYAGAVEPTHYEDLLPKERRADPAIVRWDTVHDSHGHIVDFRCAYANQSSLDLFRVTQPIVGGSMQQDMQHLVNVGLWDVFVHCFQEHESAQFTYPSPTEVGAVYPTIVVPTEHGVICTFYREVVS